MAAKAAVVRLLHDITIPAVFAICLAILPIANYKLGGGVWMPGPVTFLVIRVLVVASAGFIATYRTKLGIVAALVAGASVFFAEQAVVAIWFVVDGQSASAVQVVFSFAMFVWVAAIVGGLGGLAGKAVGNRDSAAI